MKKKIQSYFMQNKQDKLITLIVFLIMCLAFSIPFGHQYGRKIIVVILVLWIFAVTKKDLIYVLTNKFVLILLSFIFVHYISLFWSENIDGGLFYIRTKLIYLVFPIIIFSSIIQKKHIPYIISGFVAGMFVNEIISYLIYFDLYETAYSKIHRYPVGFLNHITYSVLVAFAAVLILYQAKFMKNIYIKFIYIIFFITMTTNLVISSGRTGYIVFFGSLIIMLFTYYKVTLKNFLQILVFPTLVFIIGYKLDAGVQARVAASFDAVGKINVNKNYDTSFGTRLAFYPLTKDIVMQKHNSILFGVGTGDIKSELKESINRTKIINGIYSHTHNSYMEAYLNTGVIGLFILLFLFYALWTIKIKNSDIKFIQQLIIINMMIAILSDRLLEITPSMFFFALFCSIVLAEKKSELEMSES